MGFRSRTRTASSRGRRCSSSSLALPSLCSAWLSEHGIALAATTPDTDLDYTDVDYTGPIAIAVGAEKYGLTDEILAAADYRIRIPMAGRANSLNVATSAAVVIYEAVRQRRRASTSKHGG